jgi:hypothetical protein
MDTEALANEAEVERRGAERDRLQREVNET